MPKERVKLKIDKMETADWLGLRKKRPRTKSPELGLCLAMLLFAGLELVAVASKQHTGPRTAHKQRLQQDPSALPTTVGRQARRLTGAEEEADPMEACYLAQNRASETLTISESTPVGTVVGEIMVNGDPSRDGNIELSIRMPLGASGNQASATEASLMKSTTGRHHSTGTEDVQRLANDYYPAATPNASLSERIGSAKEALAILPSKMDHSQLRNNKSIHTRSGSTSTGSKTVVRDLSEKIDSMPPLSLEQGTKRLILAKKLDRENLDKYLHHALNSISQSSSASLTVHIKCQLRSKRTREESLRNQLAGNSTLSDKVGETGSSPAAPSGSGSSVLKSLSANSILIPIHLIITDENDNWPHFIDGPYIIDLNETAQVGSLLQNNEILAFDNDQQGPLSTIEYSILQGSFWSDSFGFLNPLDSRSLIVKDNRLLDYETQSRLTLKVMARDQGDPPNWAITSLYINLVDQDDMSPVFNEDKYFGVVRENRPGEKIDLLPKRMIAVDGDKSLSAPVIYSFYMKTNHSFHFDLDPDLGQLTLKKTLPEMDPSTLGQPFCLLIKASQVDNPQRWTLTSVGLRLSALHKSKSLSLFGNLTFGFSQSNFTIEVSEAAQVGTTVFTARASHQEATNYRLLDNELGYLNIDPHSGRLTINKLLDYEMFRQLSVRVLATVDLSSLEKEALDSSPSPQTTAIYPKLACDITRVTLNILNHNDFAPEFSHDQYNFQLSISDLIANFESPNRHELREQFPEGNNLNKANRINSKPFGEIELDDSTDEFDQRALQLGQVYCADRDYGDTVSLQLSGSKANLFHLTQDGRLFLPLVNNSIATYFRGQASGQGDATSPSTLGSKSNRSEQSSLTRVFAMKRSDEQQSSLDRGYLNYLLSELSNLARLRLKAHAVDGAQLGNSKQSTALIVVTIISIDNFIIQRAPSFQLRQQQDLASPANDTTSSYHSMTNNGESDSTSTPVERGRLNQFMMIPSTNGKSFVHINPDIIGNLFAGSGGGKKLSEINGRPRTPLPDALDASASDAVGSSLSPSGVNLPATNNGNTKYQPPGLLLVDDDGAKFVAMPTALELYERQVQEATGQQEQARQKYQKIVDRQSSKSSVWHVWAEKLGIYTDNGMMPWLNLSTVIVLQLIVIVCIVSLVTRVRVLVLGWRAGSSRDTLNSNSGFDEPHPWQQRISNLSSFFASKTSSATDMLGQQNSTYGKRLAPVELRDQFSPFEQAGSDQDGPVTSSSQGFKSDNASRYRQQSIVSSGVVVSSNSGNNIRGICGSQTESSFADARNQPLFEHLKLTLNKMLDSERNSSSTGNGDTSHIFSALPQEVDASELDEQRERQVEVSAQLRETTELPMHKSKKTLVEEKSSISTFVGTSHRQVAQQQKQHQQPYLMAHLDGRAGSQASPTVVSINVAAAKQQHSDFSSRADCLADPATNNPSSHSSNISLVSMASSLSNKISEAVCRVGSSQANGSDASSLNSSILLSGPSVKDSEHRPQAPRAPPAPPPLPPPPSVARIIAQEVANTRPASVSSRSKRTPTNIKRALQAQPLNPVHIKLRHDSVADQHLVRYHLKDRYDQEDQNWSQAESNAFEQQPTGVGGRREARLHEQMKVPSALASPLLKIAQQQTVRGRGVSATASPEDRKQALSNKTVSPTTSVDRGYESFQSSSSQANGRQFLSLQECQQLGKGEAHEPSALSLTNFEHEKFVKLRNQFESRRVGRTAPLDQAPLMRGVHTLHDDHRPRAKRASPSPRHPRDRAQFIQALERQSPIEACNKIDCDTEDDDFHYYCDETVHCDSQQVGCGLSGYARHTYRQHATSFQQAQASLASKSLSHWRRRHNLNQQHAFNGEHSNDLTPPCEQQRLQAAAASQACDSMLQQHPQQRRTPGPVRCAQMSARHSNPSSHQMSDTNHAGHHQKKLTWSDQVGG